MRTVDLFGLECVSNIPSYYQYFENNIEISIFEGSLYHYINIYKKYGNAYTGDIIFTSNDDNKYNLQDTINLNCTIILQNLLDYCDRHKI